MKQKSNKNITHWAFLVGAILAAVIAVGSLAQWTVASSQWVPVVLVVLGLAVGFYNISGKETTGFLVAAIALLAFGGNGLSSLDTLIPKLGSLLAAFVQAFSFFVGAAAVVVAFKEAWTLANN